MSQSLERHGSAGGRMAAFLAALAFATLAAPAVAQSRSRASEVRPDLIYHNYCSVCHGDRGDARSRAQGSFHPPPADFTSAEARKRMTRELMIAAVTHGKNGTAMTSWTTQLSAREIVAVVDFIRDTMMAPEPGSPLARGRGIFGHQCAACHGDRGQGIAAGPGHPAPKPFAGGQTEGDRARMIASVSDGRFGSIVHAYSAKLQAGEIEAVVDYVRKSLAPALLAGVSGTQAHGGRSRDASAASAVPGAVDMSLKFANGLAGNAERGKRLYLANCATCHGDRGDGKGPRAYFIKPKPRNFVEEPARSAYNRPALYAAVAFGSQGTEMPAWNKVLTEQQMSDVAEYVFRAYIRPTQSAAAAKR